MNYFKRCIAAALFATVFAVAATAQRPVITPVSDVEHYIPASGDLEYSFTSNVEQLFSNPVFPDSAHWSVAGDLQIVSGQNSPTVIIRSVNRNINYNKDGYGKGRIYLHYGKGDCGWQSVSYDLYKIFDPPFGIAGPGCVVAGDTVVYSYEPILTVNPNSYIGTDGYKWDFSQFSGATPLYYSGDSSAVTLKINSVNDGNNVGIYVGRANFDDPAKRVTLGLSRRAPMPDVVSELCESAEVHEITLSIQNPPDDVYYSWELPSQFAIVMDKSDTERWTYIRMKLIDNQPGDITVRASYTNETENVKDCSVSEAIIHVNRSFEATAAITGESCVAAGGNYYGYSLTGAPANSMFVWEKPDNWQWEDNTPPKGATARLRPATNASLTDTLRVTLLPCNSNTLKFAVNVKPGRVTINGDPCVERGDTVTFSAVAGAPATQNYVWEVPTNLGWSILSGQGTGEVNVIVSKNYAGVVKVTPQGIGGCNGETVELATQFRPTSPNGIIMPDNCINSGMPDTVVFSVDGLTNQLYAWNIGELGTIIGDATGATIQVETSGIDGSYPVSVSALGSGSSCGNSSAVTDTVTIAGENIPDPDIYQIRRSVTFDFFEIIDLGYSYLWLLDGVDITNYGFGGKQTYWVEIPLETLAISNSLSVTITNPETGCTLRRFFDLSPYHSQTRGKSIQNSNGGNRTVQDIPLRDLVQFDFTVSPNPAKATVNVNFTGNGTGTVSLSLYNISGVLVKTWDKVATPDVSLDVSSISTGNYILIADQNNNYSTKRLVVR